MRSAPRFPTPGFLIALAVLLALAHALAALTATAEKSMTADEIGHLTAGLAYNTRGDFRFQPENGNLPQRWAALPATLAGTELPPAAGRDWQRADVWATGRTFFFRQGLSADWVLFLGRAMITLFSAATGLLIFFWSRRHWGWKGGFLSLLLYALSPSLLAHGALATSDVVMTFFLLAAVGAWWRHLEYPGFAPAAVSATVFGLAVVAKFSAVLLLPMFALIAGVWILGEARRSSWPAALGRLLRSSTVHGAAAVGSIWLFYGFRFSPFVPGLAEAANYNHGWAALSVNLGWPRHVIFALRDWHLLPDAFLYGFTFVVQFAKQRAAFLNGEYSIHGWTHFFPYTFLVKNPLPLLGLFAAGAVAAWHRLEWTGTSRDWRRLRPLTPLLALFLVYWLTSLTSHLNIGERHILPTYPVLFILAGALGATLTWRRPLALTAVLALTGWTAWESARIRPHYLAYFNALAGGPENGWRHLADSSLDWGQDLPGLRRWLDRAAPGETVYLSYFGTGDPAYEGLKATLLPCVPDPLEPPRWHALNPGIYALGATMLQHVYSSIRGAWTDALEKEYLELRPLEPLFLEYQNNPVRRAALLRDAPAAKWVAGWRRYEELRFARLCHYLRARPADAQVGYSIFIFRLTRAEIAGATAGSREDWQRWIDRATAAHRP